MAEMLIGKEILGAASTRDGAFCRVDILADDESRSALVFPLDQLRGLVSLLLQVEQSHVEQSEEGKYVLPAESVDVGADSSGQTVLLAFHVGEMEFPFALPREHAVNLMDVIRNKLPTH